MTEKWDLLWCVVNLPSFLPNLIYTLATCTNSNHAAQPYDIISTLKQKWWTLKMRFGWEGGKRRTPGAQASGRRPWCPCWSQSGARRVSRSSRPTPEPPASLRGAAWKPARYSTAQQHTRDGGRCRRSYRRQRSRPDEEGTRRQRGRGRVARARTAAWTARTPLAASSQRFGARSAAARWWSGGPVPDAWARGYGDRWATVGAPAVSLPNA